MGFCLGVVSVFCDWTVGLWIDLLKGSGPFNLHHFSLKLGTVRRRSGEAVGLVYNGRWSSSGFCLLSLEEVDQLESPLIFLSTLGGLRALSVVLFSINRAVRNC